jgi:hypothetical protein
LGADPISDSAVAAGSALLRDVSRRRDLFPGRARRGELRINQ